MMDRPTSLELVQAVRLFLEKELQPALTDARLRFQTLIAAHVLGIVERELPNVDQLLTEESQLLTAILGHGVSSLDVARANEELCHLIREGHFDEAAAMRTLLGQLRPQVIRKLQIANPRYLSATPVQAAR
jgi:prophage DNA circulation protein